MQPEPADDADRVVPLPASRPSRLWREVRRHPFAYLVTLAFAGIGAVAAPLVFPDASPWVGAIGGLIFGVYAALCAVPDKFLGS